MPSDRVIRTRNLYVLTKDMTLFWGSICKSSNTRIPLASMVDNCTGEESTAHIWQCHYNSYHTIIQLGPGQKPGWSKAPRTNSPWSRAQLLNSKMVN